MVELVVEPLEEEVRAFGGEEQRVEDLFGLSRHELEQKASGADRTIGKG